MLLHRTKGLGHAAHLLSSCDLGTAVTGCMHNCVISYDGPLALTSLSGCLGHIMQDSSKAVAWLFLVVSVCCQQLAHLPG